MKIIRWFLGKLILFFDRMFPARAVERPPAEQAKVDAWAAKMLLYQFEACPFCVKVRRAAQRMRLPIELRDARKEPRYAEELVVGGGKLQVPCLRIRGDAGTPASGPASGNDRWLYESSDIIEYLEKELRMALSNTP